MNYTVTGGGAGDRNECEPTNITGAIYFAQIMANADRREKHVKVVEESGYRGGTRYIIRPEHTDPMDDYNYVGSRWHY